jgi:hypothetical protein
LLQRAFMDLGMGVHVLVPEVRLAPASTPVAGAARVTLGPRAMRELGAALGDAVAVDVRWHAPYGYGHWRKGEGVLHNLNPAP